MSKIIDVVLERNFGHWWSYEIVKAEVLKEHKDYYVVKLKESLTLRDLITVALKRENDIPIVFWEFVMESLIDEQWFKKLLNQEEEIKY